MLDFSGEEKDPRFAWTVMADDKYLFLVKSGGGCLFLEEKFKKLDKFVPTLITKEYSDILDDKSVILIAEVGEQQKLL